MKEGVGSSLCFCFSDDYCERATCAFLVQAFKEDTQRPTTTTTRETEHIKRWMHEDIWAA